MIQQSPRGIHAGRPIELPRVRVTRAETENPLVEFPHGPYGVLGVQPTVQHVSHELVGTYDRCSQLLAPPLGVVGARQPSDVVNSALHAEHGVDDVESSPRRGPRVIQDLDGQGRLADLACGEPEGFGHDVQRPSEAAGVREHDRAAVRGGVVECCDARLSPQPFGAVTNGAQVAAEIDVAAREGPRSRQRGHPSLIPRHPEIHRLPADQNELAVQVRDLCKDGSDVEVPELVHSSGLEPRKLMRTCGNTK